MHKYCLNILYVGTAFLGWQRQAKQKQTASIQETLEKALFEITGESCSVVGSGRTDAGVHSIAQVAHFVLKNKHWSASILHRALNAKLPKSIRIAEVNEVSLSFHAQRSAIKKQYSYYFQQGPCSVPQLENLSWWIQKQLNIEAMNEAIQCLIGVHDFKPFQSRGTLLKSTVREIFEAEVSRVPVGFPLGFSLDPKLENFYLVRVRLVGSGFLKQMVRGISGTLLQIGDGRRPVGHIQAILNSKNRNLVGSTAPGKGLWQEKIWYS